MDSPTTFTLGRRLVGPGEPCLIIAEIGQAHDGSLGMAHAYIDAAAGAGADAVKFQTHIAAAESTPGEPFRIPFSPQDASRYDYWQRMEFTEEQWRGLAEHAAEQGLIFLSTPFSLQAADLLDRLKVPAWKIGSGETTHLPLLRRVSATRRPVLLSSGMATWEELDQAVEAVREAGAPVALFQCTTAYPTEPETLGLNVLAELRRRYDAPVGLSDHSGEIYAGLAAATLGANLLEVHLVLSKQSFGPDVGSSLIPEQLASLVQGTRYIQTALAHPLDKNAMAGELEELRRIFGKSLVAARDLSQGHRLEAADLAVKKPAGGLPPAALDETVGRTLQHPVSADQPLSEDDLA